MPTRSRVHAFILSLILRHMHACVLYTGPKLFDIFSVRTRSLQRNEGCFPTLRGLPSMLQPTNGSITQRRSQKPFLCKTQCMSCHIMDAFNCFMFTLHAQLYIVLLACLTSTGIRTMHRWANACARIGKRKFFTTYYTYTCMYIAHIDLLLLHIIAV